MFNKLHNDVIKDDGLQKVQYQVVNTYQNTDKNDKMNMHDVDLLSMIVDWVKGKKTFQLGCL